MLFFVLEFCIMHAIYLAECQSVVLRCARSCKLAIHIGLFLQVIQMMHRSIETKDINFMRKIRTEKKTTSTNRR